VLPRLLNYEHEKQKNSTWGKITALPDEYGLALYICATIQASHQRFKDSGDMNSSTHERLNLTAQ